ncbi:DoxX-like protein [Maribacter vaceletii]|uniref:DoxX-like protein n=1 Tax=Maribacter vaceletii TaxID=1206816 RepID=A0A495EDB5_9FLAO|nr:DoxX family membrane protein [Maribacter vaceletii]RKR14796.1 DoxX-like protein [Maribacter vaceletii]
MEPIFTNATEILILLFLIITFLQSGYDKIADWNGNVSWLKGHFAETPLKNMVPMLVAVILVTEIIAGVLCAIGIYQLYATGISTFAMYGAILSCVVLLMLLFGQRVAKDYDGARTIAIYFIPAIFLVFLLQG